MKLSVIIINYNTYELTKQTVESVLKENPPFSREIILVDNASEDGSMERLKSDFKEQISVGTIKVIENKGNLGFSKANNVGIKASEGEYVLLLNSDTKVLDDCFEKCVTYIEKDPSIGALGCKVLLPDGNLDHACKRGFPTPEASLYYFLGWDKKNPEKYGQYDALHLGEDEIGEVDSLTGAFMLMPRKVLDEVGLLDEDYFMYGEDIDLCYRIKSKGYTVMYYPKAKIIHYKGGSGKRQRGRVIYSFHKTMWIFYRKHYFKQYNIFVSVLVYLGIWIKYGLARIKNTFLRKEQA